MAKSPMFNGIVILAVSTPSVNTTVGVYTPSGAFNAVVMVSDTASRLPGPNPTVAGSN